jgi:hypothetical protein
MFLPNKNYSNGIYIIEGNTSFSRQHHSTNTLGDQHVLPQDYFFEFSKDHHDPLNEQEHVELIDEQKMSNERPLTPNNRQHFDPNVWVNLIKSKKLNSSKSLF